MSYTKTINSNSSNSNSNKWWCKKWRLTTFRCPNGCLYPFQYPIVLSDVGKRALPRFYPSLACLTGSCNTTRHLLLAPLWLHMKKNEAKVRTLSLTLIARVRVEYHVSMKMAVTQKLSSWILPEQMSSTSSMTRVQQGIQVYRQRHRQTRREMLNSPRSKISNTISSRALNKLSRSSRKIAINSQRNQRWQI